MTNTPATAALAGPWSEVRVGDRVMRYRRSGSGPTILLLVQSDSPSTRSPVPRSLIDSLAMRARLIAPDLPTGCYPTNWLADFFEGLGAIEVTVLAAGKFCVPAIELALREIDQINRIALVPDGEPDDSTSEGALTATVGTRQIPLLIARPGVATETSLALIASFLIGP